jgi:polysaccharide export outer membrane protein
MPVYDYSQEPDPSKSEYVLGIGDALSINVWHNNDLSSEVIVRPDGTITMPLIGDVRAAGETPSSLKTAIQGRLAQYIKDNSASELTVAVKHAASYRVTVAGEVNHPGVFNSDHYMTISEAIAQAGGFTRFAKRNDMTLQRRDPKSNRVKAIPLAYDFLVDGSHPEMNLTMIAGDSLYVP